MSRERYLASFDNLHLAGKYFINEYSEAGGESSSDQNAKKKKKSQIADEIIDLLYAAYLLGWRDVYEDLDISRVDRETYEYLVGNRSADIQDTIYKKFDGEDVKDRIEKYLDSLDPDSLQKVIVTEYHRDYCAGGIDMAKGFHEMTGTGVDKTWETMMDDRVRDTHDYLQSMEVPVDEDFYTYDNDHAPMPGGFIKAENNIGCRCWLKFSKA